jgi:antagonist of KipI
VSIVEVETPGLYTTIQDLGREGFGPLGISPSGAADPISLRLGNRLVGNAENAAGLEMTLLGGAFRFPRGAIVGLTGSDFGADIGGVPVDPWMSVDVPPGQTLRIGPTRSGARCYLCVRGGIDVPLFLGSASTHALTGLGGLEGRALKKGDVLKIGSSRRTFKKRKIASEAVEHLLSREALRVTQGPQRDWFLDASQRSFYDGPYRVMEESNRMGLRLQGPSVAVLPERRMITEGVSLGAIQVPSGGQPIILFVEQQTTGGYPKIANVISADLHRLGQLRPRDEIRFEQVGLDAARLLLKEQEDQIASEEFFEHAGD